MVLKSLVYLFSKYRKEINRYILLIFLEEMYFIYEWFYLLLGREFF